MKVIKIEGLVDLLRDVINGNITDVKKIYDFIEQKSFEIPEGKNEDKKNG